MECNYENVSHWFDVYFEDVRRNQANLETVPNLRKYFTTDFELVLYTSPLSPPPKSMSRDALLISFVHPDLHEDIVPRDYAIDLKRMIVAVRFEIRFHDRVLGKTWEPIQASAHYHLIAEEDGDLKIRKIHYWTERLPEDLLEIWAKRREEALTAHALGYINTGS